MTTTTTNRRRQRATTELLFFNLNLNLNLSLALLFLISIFISTTAMSEEENFRIISREEWQANEPKLREEMKNPVPFVVIHHSHTPKACNTTEECKAAMRSMQRFHQVDRGWNDIGYSFAVGGDGNAYVGRGWSAIGAHAPKMNNQSIGICVIGDWTKEDPPKQQQDAIFKLIEEGIKLGMIQENYTLIGHRQVRNTECPGEKFFQTVKTYPHFHQIDDKFKQIDPPFTFVSRDSWGANPPKEVEIMTNPVPYVVIHHSYIPPACTDPEDCKKAMKAMQKMHQEDRGWNDVGYNFAVGGDNRAYIGRGWSAIGAHAPGFNNQSIGICIIGDWREQLPSEEHLTVIKQLIEYGVELGMIAEDYKLFGHNQAKETECPGKALIEEITTWPHFVKDPFEDSNYNNNNKENNEQNNDELAKNTDNNNSSANVQRNFNLYTLSLFFLLPILTQQIHKKLLL